jgi:hypothetical protein
MPRRVFRECNRACCNWVRIVRKEIRRPDTMFASSAFRARQSAIQTVVSASRPQFSAICSARS